MPEGPEIRRAADRIAAVLGGQTLEEVWFGLPRLSHYGPALTGRRVTAVDTRGKALLIRFDAGVSLYAHNQLYGRWYLRNRGQLPRTRRSLRVALHTKSDSALLYSASELALLTPDEERDHPYLARLGPDVLDSGLGWREVAQRIDLPAFRNRALGGLYLDQRFLAGIGNYLRAEILFAAGLHPARKPRGITPGQRALLARQTLIIAQRAYQSGGVTVAPERARVLKSQGLSYAAYRFAVFSRAGKPCPVCGTPIERADAAARRIYLCPSCQPAAGR